MVMINRTCGLVVLVLCVMVAQASDYQIECGQGLVLLNNRCVLCPNNTYWAMNVHKAGNVTTVTGVYCADCPVNTPHSSEGSRDITMCTCNDARCEPEKKATNLPMIVGIIGALFGIGVIIAALAWCKANGEEFLKMFSANNQDIESTDADESLLQRSPSPNLLDCAVDIQVTDEQIDDEYNDLTTKGDINDMEAVLRAAVISEKRRSRVYSMSSMTDLSGRYRTSSACESMGARSGYGIEKADASHRDVQLPLPAYAVNGRHAQTNL